MKFKIKEYPKTILENEFLIFPRKFEGYKYWLCWVTVEYHYLDYLRRYQRFGSIVKIGKTS